MKRHPHLAVLIVAGATMGILSVLAPYVLMHGITGEYQSPLFPLLRNAWEELAPVPTVALLILAGAALGFIRPKHWLILGTSTALFFPLAAILEMATDPQSHKLWPIEFILYIVLVAGPGMLGALVGSKLKAPTQT